MCTSFAVYRPEPLYGMNFDFPDVEMRFLIEETSQGKVFYLGFEWEGNLYRTAGVNAAGLFSAAQILVAHFEITHLPDEERISPYEVFIKALQHAERIDDVLEILGPRRLEYTTQRKGHQIYADQRGGVCILEPEPLGNQIFRSNDPFTVMANRPILKDIERIRNNGFSVNSTGDRFITAHKLIQEKFGNFSLDQALKVLQEVQLTRGRFTTQASMVCDPQAREIYLALRRDFDKVWKISLQEGYVETYTGFSRYSRMNFDVEGIRGSQLLSN